MVRYKFVIDFMYINICTHVHYIIVQNRIDAFGNKMK